MSLFYYLLLVVYLNVSQTFLLENTFWLRKTITDPHILAHVNILPG
jgi:hypothetical protein